MPKRNERGRQRPLSYNITRWANELIGIIIIGAIGAAIGAMLALAI